MLVMAKHYECWPPCALELVAYRQFTSYPEPYGIFSFLSLAHISRQSIAAAKMGVTGMVGDGEMGMVSPATDLPHSSSLVARDSPADKDSRFVTCGQTPIGGGESRDGQAPCPSPGEAVRDLQAKRPRHIRNDLPKVLFLCRLNLPRPSVATQVPQCSPHIPQKTLT